MKYLISYKYFVLKLEKQQPFKFVNTVRFTMPNEINFKYRAF